MSHLDQSRQIALEKILCGLASSFSILEDPTERHFVLSIQLVIIPGGHEDVHWVSDHGDVDSLGGFSHPLTDQRVIKPAIQTEPVWCTESSGLSLPGVETKDMIGHIGVVTSYQVPLFT